MSCVYDSKVSELMRCIRAQASGLISGGSSNRIWIKRMKKFIQPDYGLWQLIQNYPDYKTLLKSSDIQVILFQFLGLPDKEMTAMELGLAHSLSRYKLKFSPDKIDTMIVQVMISISKYPSRWFLSNESPQSEYYFLYWSEVWGRIIGNPYLLVMFMINQEVILIQMKEDFILVSFHICHSN